MPEISVQHQRAALTDLVSCESFGTPIGDLPKQTDSGFYQEGNLTAGTWECEPVRAGFFRRDGRALLKSWRLFAMCPEQRVNHVTG